MRKRQKYTQPHNTIVLPICCLFFKTVLGHLLTARWERIYPILQLLADWESVFGDSGHFISHYWPNYTTTFPFLTCEKHTEEGIYWLTPWSFDTHQRCTDANTCTIKSSLRVGSSKYTRSTSHGHFSLRVGTVSGPQQCLHTFFYRESMKMNLCCKK